MFWSWGGATQQGVVGLSVFFSLLTFLFNCEPGFASSRFDSGVSILVAAFVRPDGWIQGRLVLQRPSRPVLDARTRYCTGPYFTAGNIIARAVRHGSSFWSCNGREAMSPIWREVARVAGSLSDTLLIGRFTRQYMLCVWMKRRCCACSSQLDCIRCNARPLSCTTPAGEGADVVGYSASAYS